MGETIARATLYGLIAAASPMAFAATVVVLRSRRARLNGLFFAAAFLLAGLGVVLAVVAIGSAAAPRPGGSGTAAAVLELAFGVLLVAAGQRVRRGSAAASTDGPGRTQALLDRLAQITPKTALPAGALLGIGGPKRLTIGIVAATTIAAADLTKRERRRGRVVRARGERARVGSRRVLCGGRPANARVAHAGRGLAARESAIVCGRLSAHLRRRARRRRSCPVRLSRRLPALNRRSAVPPRRAGRAAPRRPAVGFGARQVPRAPVAPWRRPALPPPPSPAGRG